jgi:predicted MFS family arabinose efflux permease
MIQWLAFANPSRERNIMDLTSLVFGLVLGSCVTSALVWMLRPRDARAQTGSPMRSIMLSVVLTAILGGLARTGIEYGSSGVLTMAGVLFGTGWLVGGLLAGWFLANQIQR